MPPAFSPVLAKDEHQGPISASSGMIAPIITSILLRRYWRGTWPWDEHIFITRGNLDQPRRSPTHPRGHLSQTTRGGSPPQSCHWVDRLAHRAEQLRYELRGGLHCLINGLICLTLIIESCHLGSDTLHGPLARASPAPEGGVCLERHHQHTPRRFQCLMAVQRAPWWLRVQLVWIRTLVAFIVGCASLRPDHTT